MGREIRRVPANWKHPIDAGDRWVQFDAPGYNQSRWKGLWQIVKGGK